MGRIWESTLRTLDICWRIKFNDKHLFIYLTENMTLRSLRTRWLNEPIWLNKPLYVRLILKVPWTFYRLFQQNIYSFMFFAIIWPIINLFFCLFYIFFIVFTMFGTWSRKKIRQNFQRNQRNMKVRPFVISTLTKHMWLLNHTFYLNLNICTRTFYTERGKT
jgi:hypothetical protein